MYMKCILKISVIVGIVVIGMLVMMLFRNKYFEILKNLEIFINFYKEINIYYVDDVDLGQFMCIGIDVMMELFDFFINYILELEIEGYWFMIEGKYNGIGVISQ